MDNSSSTYHRKCGHMFFGTQCSSTFLVDVEFGPIYSRHDPVPLLILYESFMRSGFLFLLTSRVTNKRKRMKDDGDGPYNLRGTDTNRSRTEAIEQMLLKPRLSTVSNVDWTIVRVGAFKATASTARHYQSQSQINSSPAAVAGRRYQQQQHRTSLHAARMMIMMIMTLYKELHIVSAWQRPRWGIRRVS